MVLAEHAQYSLLAGVTGDQGADAQRHAEFKLCYRPVWGLVCRDLLGGHNASAIFAGPDAQ